MTEIQAFKYRQALVSYVDILGFRQLVKESDDDPAKGERILNILRVLKKEAEFGWIDHGADNKIVRIFFPDNFSDTLIRTTFIGSRSLAEYIDSELMILCSIQAELTAVYGLMLRGGISLGGMYREDDPEKGKFIFGPALVRSYELAEELAVVPRILIDPDLIRRMTEHKQERPFYNDFAQCRKQAEDGSFFIDYLNWEYRIRDLYSPKGIQAADEMLELHKKVAEQKLLELGAKGERLRQKARWLAVYHNNTVNNFRRESPYLTPRLQSLSIDEAKLMI
jgi:hypothetical protein